MQQTMMRNSYIAHHGVKGQKRGIRQYQYKDGSLTPLGRIHYGIGNGVRRYQNEDGSLTPAMAKRYRKNTAKKLSVEHPDSGKTYTNLKNKFVSQNAELNRRYEDNSEQIKTLMKDYNQAHYGALFGIARSIKQGNTTLSNIADNMYVDGIEDGSGSSAAYLITKGKERQAARLYKEYRELSTELTNIGRKYVDDELGSFKDAVTNKKTGRRITVGVAVLDKLVRDSDSSFALVNGIAELSHLESDNAYTPSRSDIMKAKKFIENFTVPLTSKTIAELYTLEEQYDWDRRDMMAFSKKDWEFVNEVLRKA